MSESRASLCDLTRKCYRNSTVCCRLKIHSLCLWLSPYSFSLHQKGFERPGVKKSPPFNPQVKANRNKKKTVVCDFPSKSIRYVNFELFYILYFSHIQTKIITRTHFSKFRILPYSEIAVRSQNL